jgi:hypothetical protein
MEAHHYHLSQEWEMLVRLLQSPPQVVRVPFMAPDLPPYYVERREEMNRLKEALLAGGSESRAGDIGLWGPRGCGKGTLAAIFCHDEDTIAHFSDGILWTTLGPEPHVLVELTKLYAALTGERPRFVEEEDATEQLAQRLGERNCLLVIEDVWNMQHLKPFLLSGSQCKRLILTCDLSILTNISAEVVSLGGMTPEEAIALLRVRLNLSPAEGTLFTPFTERLGRLPLASG